MRKLLLRILWIEFRAPNRIHFAVRGSLHLRERERESEHDCSYYCCGVSFWRPLWIACNEAMQEMPRVFLKWYCLMMKVIALMTGRNAMEIVWKGQKVTRPVQKTLSRMVIAELK
jgi:hypothetical protein